LFIYDINLQNVPKLNPHRSHGIDEKATMGAAGDEDRREAAGTMRKGRQRQPMTMRGRQGCQTMTRGGGEAEDKGE
jgi:hypothetical protein